MSNEIKENSVLTLVQREKVEGSYKGYFYFLNVFLDQDGKVFKFSDYHVLGAKKPGAKYVFIMQKIDTFPMEGPMFYLREICLN